jgi:membrane protein
MDERDARRTAAGSRSHGAASDQTGRETRMQVETSGADLPGGEAESPKDIPAAGWKQILLRVKDEIKTDNVVLLAAGVAFYALLGIFPALIAAITLWGLVSDPAQIERTIAGVTDVMPQEAADLLTRQLSQIAGSGTGALSWTLGLSLLGALWAASTGTKGLMNAVNTTYNEVPTRTFLRERGLALLLTLGAIVFALLTLALIAVLPAAIGALGFGETVRSVILIARWPLLLIAVMAALALLYRFAPDRDDAQWSWLSWGAVFAGLLWLVASIGFSVYVQNFGNYDETYGALGAVIILMLWFFITALCILIGAEINAEMERQTTHDTTRGEPQPMGQRRAVVADGRPEADGTAPPRG